MQFLDLAGVKKFKRYVDENFTTVEEHENAEQVTAAAINDLNERLVDVEEEDWVTADDYSHIEGVIRDYYTKEEVDEKIEEVDSDLSDYYTKYQADDRYLQTETDPTVPAHVKAITSSDISNWNSKTNNTGTVTQVKVGTTPYNPTSGVVSLPEYPTTLPASDVPAWAKSPTKPTYTATEVGAATTTYVDTAVAGIVNSAPTTLDTLNELATALGNDPNFATTVATQIGQKVDTVKVGTTDYTPTNGVVSLPAYPTVTDTKNTAGSTDTSSKIFLIGAASQAANPQTYSDNEVYATSGVLTTKSVQVGGTAATMQYNSTDQSIEFIFA